LNWPLWCHPDGKHGLEWPPDVMPICIRPAAVGYGFSCARSVLDLVAAERAIPANWIVFGHQLRVR
jgi:hypothetical protein